MKYSIITFGCQMNKNDSERIAKFLNDNELEETTEEKADLIIINACSVRQSAVDRIRGKIGNLKGKSVTTILTGCVLEKDKKDLGNSFDYVLPIEDLTNWPLSFLVNKNKKDFFHIDPKREGISASISIMKGCENFCTYCVVPYTRGKLFSRPANDILEEAKKVIDEGYKEIWLLGQNVNSYNGEITFPELLQEINKIKGDFWIRFTSSHPRDFSDELIKTMKDCKKVTKYLNLPIQSGDNEILKKMNRPYTVEEYKSLVEKIKKSIPEISLSTDIIVGFPGETEKNFRNTIKIFNELSFDMIYSACYSPRPQTVAYKMKDDIPIEEKKRREKILQELLKESKIKKNKDCKGKKVRVLVTGITKKGELIGKTEKYNNVTFVGKKDLVGKFIKVEIIDYSSWGLKGKIIDQK